MKKFSESLKDFKEKNNFRKKWAGIYKNVVETLDKNQQIKIEIDDGFSSSAKEEKSRQDIISSIQNPVEKLVVQLEEPTRKEIDADWIYSQGIQLLSGQSVEINGCQYIIGRRRGPAGGFTLISTIDQGQAKEDVKQIEESIEKIDDLNVKIKQSEDEGATLEKTFYPLVREWGRSNGFSGCEITGGMIPLPRWENPDLIDIYCEYFNYTMDLHFEITSFEVKTRVEPAAVWQAANYMKFSTYTFIVYALPENEVRYGGSNGQNERIFEMAVQLGLGILVLEKENDGKWIFKLIQSPKRNTPEKIEIQRVVDAFARRFKEISDMLSSERKKCGAGIVGNGQFLIIPAN